MQIAFVVYDGMTALDAIGPYEILNMLPGRELRFVGHQVGPIVTDSGALVIYATHSFADTPSPDLVLVPGTSVANARIARDPELLDWLRAVHPTTRFTTSVCSGALALAGAGLLRDAPATSHWAALPLLRQLGVHTQADQRVVRQGRIVTAAGVSAGIDLALTLFAELADEDQARVAQLLIEYDPQPPFDEGHMSKASAATKRRAITAMAKAATSVPEVVATVKLLLEGSRGA